LRSLTIVGLGSGSWDDLPVGTLEVLNHARHIVLRTHRHPVVEQLSAKGITFETFDALYESADSFDHLYEQMVEVLLRKTQVVGDLVYAVPGHPSIAEKAVNLLRQRASAEGVKLHIGPGHSFLDGLLSRIGIDVTDGLVVLDAASFSSSQCHVGLHLIVMQLYSRDVASDVKLTLMERYPDNYSITLLRAAGVPGEERIMTIPLYELDRVEWIDHLTSLYVPKTSDVHIVNRQFWRLMEIVNTLRGPEGCPWDREQTHRSLRPYVLEEAYEVAKEIDRDDPDALCGELGDLLLQVTLHCQIGVEDGEFDIFDCVQRLNEKLIRRHPHVFGSSEASTAGEVETQWAAIKLRERAEKAPAGVPPTRVESSLDTVKSSVPAMSEAFELQAKAAKFGFDFESTDDIYAKISEEIAECQLAKTAAEQEAEIGDLQFTIINLARRLGVDPEAAVSRCNIKFRKRFHYIEQMLAQNGREISEATVEEMDRLWGEAKLTNRP